jgi:predicted dehydrogenase
MIRVAVIGAGHWGPNLIRNFHDHAQSTVVRVVDLDEERLAQVRARFSGVTTGTDAAAAFADEGVDAVVVATPTSTHYPLVKAALQAGKHVLVEKPIATSQAHAEELCALAAEKWRVLLVSHVFLYNAGIARIRGYIQEGLLGRVYYISTVRTNLGPIRMDVNAAWDLAAHDLSIANWWLDAEPVAASAVDGTWINPGIEDAVFATLRYPGGVLVNLHASWLSPRKSRDITVVGAKKMLTFDDMNLDEPVRIYDKQVTEARTKPSFVDTFATFRATCRDGEVTVPKIAMGEPLRAECDHFLECIVSGKEPLTGGRQGAAVVRALEAIERSARSGGSEQPVNPPSPLPRRGADWARGAPA